MPYWSDGLFEFFRLVRLRSCFVFRMCTRAFLSAQPTRAAHIVSSSLQLNLLTVCKGLVVRSKMVGTSKVERNVFYRFS